MLRSVLILAPDDDPHALAIAWALAKTGVETVCHPSLPFASNASVSIFSDAAGERLVGSALAIERVGAVWHRRPREPAGFACRDADRAFVEREWKKTQHNVYALADTLVDALWVNAPTAAVRAENKLVQLHAARAAGLAFPPTLVSNDADAARDFIARHGRVVFKTFAPHIWRNAAGDRHYGVDVTLLDRDSALPADSIALCPGIFQRYVDKVADLRVTVVGDRLFAISIRRRSGPTYLDWRAQTRAEDYVAEAVALDAGIERKLRALLARLGIVFGCVDLVVDGDGDICFLEVNQAGQFLFVEQQVPELPLLRAMTAMLASGRVDYRLEDAAAVTFADYLGCLEAQPARPAGAGSVLAAASVE